MLIPTGILLVGFTYGLSISVAAPNQARFWVAPLFAGNAVYFPLVEEKGLARRFGSEYRDYMLHVPRWVPRLKPWKQPEEGQRTDGDSL